MAQKLSKKELVTFKELLMANSMPCELVDNQVMQLHHCKIRTVKPSG